MSVAVDFQAEPYEPAPVYPPLRVIGTVSRPVHRPVAVTPLASVTTLHRPSVASIAPPLRLTRRGVWALAALVGVLAVALVAIAWLSAPAGAGANGAVASRAATRGAVVVGSGDTLWSIATRVAPGRDPRAEVADLQRLNHLHGASLVAGQVLRTR